MVKVRFAPSPTGSLHVGNALAAVANRRFADEGGGTLLLRIDDTDPARNVPGGVDAIVAELEWLGIDWDEGPEFDGCGGGDAGPYHQSQRLELYRRYADDLVARGLAYLDTAGDGPQKAVRFRVPRSGTITFHDEVRGEVAVSAQELEDLVIIKADGYPTYHFAVVVDDELMGVTHVIRAQEHLSNTPRHVLL